MSAAERRAQPREFTLAPFSYAEAHRLAQELDLAEPVAVALVRRGFRTPEAARAFLAADESHEPSRFDRIADAVDLIGATIGRGERITVHGDYDVDGVTSTTILVAALRELGADCDWLIPARVEDGYGITMATIERLSERGTRLLITADCGIGSAAEVEAARARGIATVVTDHHQPGEELPDCPIVHPVVSRYPCPDLCAAGVAHKLVAALTSVERAERDLDLVALATVADMVPLAGENRSLVRRGLAHARRATRPGLRALMAAARVVPERLDEGDLGFRLAPRINAAGRLYRADAAVELLLTADEGRAGEIAAELDRANGERRQIEAEVLADAERRLREQGADDAAALVVSGEGWHPGVVGICASRLAERHRRPAILIAIDDAGRGRGSGRSVPGWDLLAGLRACEEHLRRYGGHRAAAGLEIDRDRLDAFGAAFRAHAAATLDPESATRREAIDVVLGGEGLGHEVAAQLGRLGPFGKANPEVRLLVPGARVTEVRPLGEGERHARFSLSSGPARASGVAFGVGTGLAAAVERGPLDVSLRLELDEWNGVVSPRVVLGELYAPGPTPQTEDWRCEASEHEARLLAALEADPPAARELGPARERIDRSRASAIAAVAGLASSGEPLLVVSADAFWRRGLVESAAPPARFGGGKVAILSARGSLAAGEAAVREVLEAGGVALCDWPALSLLPGLAREFPHLALADPAPERALESVALAGEGFVHVLDSHADPSLSIRALALSLPDRAALAASYRGLRGVAGRIGPAAVRATLEAASGDARSPEWCARVVEILAEVGAVRVAGAGSEREFEVVSSVRGELEASPSFVANRTAHEECVRFLTEAKEQSSSPMRRAA